MSAEVCRQVSKPKILLGCGCSERMRFFHRNHGNHNLKSDMKKPRYLLLNKIGILRYLNKPIFTRLNLDSAKVQRRGVAKRRKG